jgi:hypothetical protein
MRNMNKEEKARNPRQLMLVTFPKPTRGTDANTNTVQEWGWIDIVRWAKTGQPQFVLDREGLESSVRLETRIGDRKNNDPLIAEWQDVWKLLCALDKPRNGYPIDPPDPMLNYIHALEEAVEYTSPEIPAERAKGED